MSLMDMAFSWLGNHAQQQQTQKGIDATNGLFGQARDSAYQWQGQGAANQQPYMKIGGSAVDNLNRLFGFNTGANGGAGAPDPSAFHTDPGYQFQLNQGVAANNASFAARGMSDSGAQQKALAQYTTGLADQSYGNYVNRLMGLVGVGQTATNTLGNQNLGYAGALLGAAGDQSKLLNSAYGTLGTQQGQMWSNIGTGINDIAKGIVSGGGNPALMAAFGG